MPPLTDCSQEKWCKLGTKTTRALALKARQLLTYSRLRRQIYYDLAHACKMDIDNGLRISEKRRAALSAFSSKPEYQISRGTGYGVPGVFVQGPFILLDEDWDVAARIRDHIAQCVSLRSSVGGSADNEGGHDEEQDDTYGEYEIEENLTLWEEQSAVDALEFHMLSYPL